MASNLYKEKKIAKKKQKRLTEKEAKTEEKLRKKMKTTAEWIDIEDVSDNGIELKKQKIVIGIRIEPINIFLLPQAEVNRRISSLASALNQLKQRLYIQFPLTEPRLDETFNYFLTLQEKSENQIQYDLIQTELDKITRYEETNSDVWFYWLFVSDLKHQEDDFKELCRLATVANFAFSKMNIVDYKNVIYDKFQNPLINNLYFSSMNDTFAPNLAKLKSNKPFLKSRSAPFYFRPTAKYIVMNENVISAHHILNFPLSFYAGLLSINITNPNQRMEIYIEPIKYNVNKLMTKRLKQIRNELSTSKDEFDINDLEIEKEGIESTIRNSSDTHLRSVNVSVTLYPRAKDEDALERIESEINLDFNPEDGWVHMKPLGLQGQLFKESSPLFLESGLRMDQKNQLGTIMPATSASGLWPYIFETLDDSNGSLVGLEATTGGHIIFNPFLYADELSSASKQNRLNNNLFVSGLSGSGKTTFVKMLIMQEIMKGHRVIYVDPENVIQNMTRQLGGVYVDWKTSENMINVFDLKPQTNDDSDNQTLIYNTKNAISNTTEDIKILYTSIHSSITDDELSMLDDVVLETYKTVGITPETDYRHLDTDAYPTFSTLYNTLEEMMYQAQSKGMLEELSNLQKLFIKTKPFIGSYARFFDGHTNFDDTNQLICFGMKEAQNKSDKLMQALTRIVFQKGWEKVLEYQEHAVLAFDESHKYILSNGVADSFSQFARRARKYIASIWFITQQGTDYNDPSIRTHGNAIITNCAYKFLMAGNENEYKAMQTIYGLNDNQILQMSELTMGRGMFILGNKKLLMDVYVPENQRRMM